MMITSAVVYVVGVLSGANGHLLYLSDWPNQMISQELEAEICSFCASRGLKHNTW